MASQTQETQGHRTNQDEAAVLHSSGDAHSTVLDALVTMSHMVYDAYNTLKMDTTHMNVCHQKRQELVDENEKLKAEAQLYQLNNYNLRTRLADALRNAANRIVDQDRKIDELVSQAKAKYTQHHATPTSMKKRGRPVNGERSEDTEQGSRKRSKNEVEVTFGQ